MLTLPPSVRIHLAMEPVSMRMSFRGLSGVVRRRLEEDPLSGHLSCCLNRRRTMMKILFHDRTGYCLFYKRLSRGTLELPSVPEGASHVQCCWQRP